MNRRQLFRYILVSSLAPLAACSRPKQAFQETIAVFGTLVRITLYAGSQEAANAAFAAVNARFQQIHTDWHAWEKGGLISKINQAIADGKPIEVNAEVAQFIQRNQELCQQSDGLFDPGIGKLIKLWGFHQNSYEGNKIPAQSAIDDLLAQAPSIRQLQWQGTQLFCPNPAVSLDFGASGKAYALNAATDTLKQQGIKQATIAIGGDIQVLGEKPDGAWRIGIADPQQPDRALATFHLASGEAACSSGTYERFYTDQGKKVSHIIHPFTGQPVHNIQHSTAIHHDSLIAEVGALAQLIAGKTDWQRIAQQLDVTLSYLIDDQQQQYISTSMQQKLITVTSHP
jgi:thiamine biosynthesis lipoprotein